jgi:hypothetical protein
MWGASLLRVKLCRSVPSVLSRIPLLEWLGTWLRFLVSEVRCVALQVTDVFTDFRSCVLSCCQVSLNYLVQNPEGVKG